MISKEPTSSRAALIERVPILFADPLKATKHAVSMLRLNIYRVVSLHFHYHLDQVIKQEDTPMRRQLGLLNKTGKQKRDRKHKIRLVDPHAHTPSARAICTQTWTYTCSALIGG